MTAQHSDFTVATPVGAPLDPNGTQSIKFNINNGKDVAESTITMKCYTAEEVKTGLKTTTPGKSEIITIEITKKEGNDSDPDDKDFIFQTSNKKIEETIKLEKDTAKINLELAVNQAIYSSCSTEKVNDTN
jgi:hypothetical protein